MKTNEVNKEISYETLLVTFGEGIGRLNTMFDDPQVWGVATLKQWIDGYETTRFTEIDDRTAVITSEYNMDSVKEWLQKNTPIINLEKRYNHAQVQMIHRLPAAGRVFRYMGSQKFRR